MNMINKGLLVVLSGPSGAGKNTVLTQLLEQDSNIKVSISATTRKPRDGELDSKNYYFISKSEFVQLISKNGMLEYAEYCGNYYGTPAEQVNSWLSKGRDVVLEIEVKGGFQVRKKCPEAISIFILPPSIKELENRLVNRATEPEHLIQERLNIAKKELKTAFEYDYIVINDKVEQCAVDICNIIASEKMKSHRNTNIIEKVINDE